MSYGKIAAFLALIALPVAADPLPPNAKPLSSKQIEKLYSGNSAVWDRSMVYFAPDKTTKGVFGKPPSATYTGKWKITKNKLCMTNSPVNIKTGEASKKTYTDCWTFFTDGDRVLTSYYNDFEEGRGPNDDYSEGELSNLRKGDVVSKTFAKYRS
ncbi:DUF995 domain-containing protein [Tabrizicola sp. J26]|uniref:DUF995 domain-containing protein n=1 Tax=Alitabrizicola rongguiensis TaxID=2909234 RepID=UPI001F1F0137|nr:DUF995 domain-containing protein [Tabrizicola rongguiensis]MCF1709102.1 DUF995 domain-containing protein [Tabrizicola rongguiensis]